MPISSIADAMAGLAKGARKGGISEAAERGTRDTGEESKGGASQLFDHGDGTFHTVVPGAGRMEHPHLGHALMHLAGHHEPDGKHTHIHHAEDGKHTTHHQDGAGVEGPHEDDSVEGLKDHLGEFLNEENQEREPETASAGKGLM